MEFLEAVDVYSGYGETEILHGVSLRVAHGEFVTIIGPNGAGKSTLVKTIIGLLKPSRGAIRLDGRDITGQNPEDLVLHGLAYVPQMNNTFPNLTVRENLEMGAITRRPGSLVNTNPFFVPLHGVRGVAARTHALFRDVAARAGTLSLNVPRRSRTYVFLEWARRMLDYVSGLGGRAAGVWSMRKFVERVDAICVLFPNLRPNLDRKVGTLSGGEQQMVALAKTLVLEPKCLLIDEPSAGLAPRLVSLVFDKIKEINSRGVAIVLVEQNAKRALALADRGYVLEAGRNRYEGTGGVLLTDPDVGRLYLGG